MRVPRITFRPLWPARSVANRTLPIPLQPGGDGSASGRRPRLAGGFAATEPASTRIIDGDAANTGRSFLGNTEVSLDSGPVPDRINRGTEALNAGKIGTGAGPAGIAGWPYDGNALMLPHQRIPRTPITVTPFARTIDTAVTIPSVAIGDPVSQGI